MTKRRVTTTVLTILAAASFSLLIGCEEAAVQTLDVTLATPTPIPQVVAFADPASTAGPAYDVTIVSQNEGGRIDFDAGRRQPARAGGRRPDADDSAHADAGADRAAANPDADSQPHAVTNADANRGADSKTNRETNE